MHFKAILFFILHWPAGIISVTSLEECLNLSNPGRKIEKKKKKK